MSKPTIIERLKATGHIVKPCGGCGKDMVWARMPAGLWMPLDAQAPVYSIVPAKDYEGKSRPEAVRNTLAFVSHFVTCPKRDQF